MNRTDWIESEATRKLDWLDWIGPNWIGPNWIGPNWIGPNWIGPKRIDNVQIWNCQCLEDSMLGGLRSKIAEIWIQIWLQILTRLKIVRKTICWSLEAYVTFENCWNWNLNNWQNFNRWISIKLAKKLVWIGKKVSQKIDRAWICAQIFGALRYWKFWVPEGLEHQH